MKNNTIKISAVIATKNEEKMLNACLQSLSWVDEIVIVDTGSTDKTLSIAKKNNVRIVNYASGKTFSDWRNKELSEAHGEWILYVDADERIPKDLQKEILSIIENSELSETWYAIPRSNVIFGKEFRHGGWWPDYVKRLYKKSALKKWEGNLHEEPVVEGKMGKLKKPMLHIKHETVFEMIQKTNQWSVIEAQLMFEAKHPPMTIPRFFTAMAREFFKSMIKETAFLDGRYGIMMAMYQVFSRFVSYAKLWEMQVKSKQLS